MDIRYTFTRGGVRIAYALFPGEGPPVLHVGAPGSIPLPMAHLVPSSTAFFDALHHGRSRVFFDFRGTGASGPIGDALAIEDQVEDIEAVVRAIGTEMHAVAWNTGCFAASLFAATRPVLWRNLALVNPALRGDNYATRHLVKQMDALREAPTGHEGPTPEHRVRTLMLRQVWDVTGEETEELARLWTTLVTPRAFSLHHEALEAVDLSEVLPGIEMPVLVVADPLIWERLAADVADRLPSGSATILSGAVYINAGTGRDLSQILEQFWRSLPSTGHNGEGDPIPPISPSTAGLSERELDVLRRIARGQSNGEIARGLGISVRTVERHAVHIYAKLAVHNRAGAATWATRHGVS